MTPDVVPAREIDIDAVAREMTAGDPHSSFRARVVAALPRQRRSRLIRVLAPAVACGALALAAMVLWRPIAPDAFDVPNLAGPSAFSAMAPRGLDSVSVLPVRVSRSTVPETEVPEWQGLTALEAPAPVGVSAIQPSALSIAPISVDPLPDPIPLTPSERPGGR
jgi:hypothetical protein